VNTEQDRKMESESDDTEERAQFGMFIVFLVATAGLFVAWEFRPVDYLHGEPTGQITVSEEQAEQLREIDHPTYGSGLLAALAEEIYVREAVSMRLHETDTIVRRRIIQQQLRRLEPERPEASEEELRAWFQDHQSQFTKPATTSFEHRFFRRDNEAELNAAIEAIEKGSEPGEEMGDPFVHGNDFNAQSLDRTRALFGSAFAESLRQADPGDWTGPVRSNFGFHLVRVNQRSEETPLSFEEARDRVYLQWAEGERRRMVDERLASLREDYDVNVPDELPEETSDE
jgi:hypothetical protein